MTDNVKLMLWNELSDVQPISLSEMPKYYLNSPNGRVFYALKTFTLKQIDMMRRDMIDKFRAGGPKEKIEATTNLLRYSAAMGLSGATVQQAKDFLTKGELDPESFDDDVYETLMSLLFWGKYSRERYLEQGNVGSFVVKQSVSLPVQDLTDRVGKGVLGMIQEDEKGEKAVANAVKQLPILGKVAYYWLLGGAERKLEYEAKQKVKEENEELRKAGINI